MKKSVRVLTVFLLLAGGVALWWGLSVPKYRGRPVRVWVEDLTSKSEFTRKEAKRAVAEIGSNAIPILLEKLMEDDRALKFKLQRLIQKVGLFDVTFTSAFEAREQGYKGFLVLGRNGKPALPALVKLLNNTNAASYASQILCDMDNDVIPALLVAATNSNSEVRVGSFVDLGYRHTNAPGVIVALVNGLNDAEARVRSGAALALAKIPQAADDAVPGLIAQLGDRNEHVRRAAAQTLGSFGSRANAAVPELLKVIHGSNAPPTEGITVVPDAERMSAIQALNAIDPTAAEKAGVKRKPLPIPSYE